MPETPEADPGVRLAALLLAAALAGWGLLSAACAGREASDPALPDSTYVDVMARLSLIREAGQGRPRPGASGRSGAGFTTGADSLEREAIRGVLRESGVEEGALVDFARQVGDEPERMSALWERIQAVSDSLRIEGWDPPGPLPPVERPGGS